jgi:hypothetical protein
MTFCMAWGSTVVLVVEAADAPDADGLVAWSVAAGAGVAVALPGAEAAARAALVASRLLDQGDEWQPASPTRAAMTQAIVG